MGLAALVRRPEVRAIDASRFAYADTFTGVTDAGVNVNEDAALSIPTFHTCIRRKAQAFQAMPVDAYITEGDIRVPVGGPRWLKQPNEDQLWREFIGGVSWSLDVDNNTFIAPTRDRSGRVVELYTLDHRHICVERHRGRRVYTIDGQQYPGEVVHIVGVPRPGELRGPSIINVNRETFGVALAVQSYAAGVFGSGGIPPMTIEVPGTFDEAGMARLRESWFRAHGGRARLHKPAILTGGATAKVVGFDMESTQMTEVQSFLSVQICALTGVPPIFAGLGIAGDSILYQNPVMAWVGFVRQALLAPMGMIEEALSELMPPAQRMRFRTEIFEKPDTRGRYEIYEIGITAGFLTEDEVRAFEDMSPLPDKPEPVSVDLGATEGPIVATDEVTP